MAEVISRIASLIGASNTSSANAATVLQSLLSWCNRCSRPNFSYAHSKWNAVHQTCHIKGVSLSRPCLTLRMPFRTGNFPENPSVIGMAVPIHPLVYMVLARVGKNLQWCNLKFSSVLGAMGSLPQRFVIQIYCLKMKICIVMSPMSFHGGCAGLAPRKM